MKGNIMKESYKKKLIWLEEILKIQIHCSIQAQDNMIIR